MGVEYDPDGLVLWKEKQTLVTTSSSSLLPGWVSKGFPELAGPFLGRQVHSRVEYSARRLSDESVPGLCCFWDSTPGHCISPGADGEPITVPPVFNICFSNTAVNISFHKKALVPYTNIHFHQFFSNQFFSKTCILSLMPALCNKMPCFYQVTKSKWYQWHWIMSHLL